MSYKKLPSEEPSPSKSIPYKSPPQLPSSKKSPRKSNKKSPSKAATTASIKSQLEERKAALKQKSQILELPLNDDLDNQDHKHQSDSDGDDNNNNPPQTPIKPKLTISDDQLLPSPMLNPINNNQNLPPSNNPNTSTSNKCGKNGINFLSILWSRGDKITLIEIPILLFLLLIAMLMVNTSLLTVWFLSGLSLYSLLIFAYFYAFPGNNNNNNHNAESILDLFSITMIYGGALSIVGWLFAWLLAYTNYILVGPFIFTPTGFVLNSTGNIIWFSILACIFYGGIFPFCILWMKTDRRLCDNCWPCGGRCNLKNVHILRDFEQLQERLDLPQHQIDAFMATNEHEIMMKLQVAFRRLTMECVSAAVGYFGGIYILAFAMKFDKWPFYLEEEFGGMNAGDLTLIFVLGYLVKDFIFAVMIGVLASYIIGRERLYGITMNARWIYYGFIMLLGILQQVPGTILCGIYPHVTLRMDIIYVCIGVNAIIVVIGLFEILRQRKLLKVQLDALFIYNAINKEIQGGSEESSIRMDNLSVQYIDIEANVNG